MPKTFNFRFRSTPNSHFDTAAAFVKPNSSDYEAPSAKDAAHIKGSFDLASKESMTATNSFVEEPRVEPSDFAGEVQFFSQNAPRVTQQDQHYRVYNLRNKKKQLSRALAKERAASRDLASKLDCSEKCNGRLQMALVAQEQSSQPHKKDWIDVSTGEYHTETMQEEAGASQMKLQVGKETRREIQTQLKDHVEALQVVREQLTACQEQVQAFEAELLRMRDYEQDLRKTREKLAASQQELRACRDDLFRLQPAAQVTDADISRDYESLCQRINDWIEGEMSSFEDAHPNAKPGQMFLATGSPEINTFIQNHSELGEYLIRNMIHRRLQGIMFDKDVLLFGIPYDLVQVLQSAEQSMAMLEPRRGNRPPNEYTSIDTWRSETLTALSATESFANQRQGQLEKVSQHIFRKLSTVFPIINLHHQSFTRFYDRVMSPAANLALKTQTSTSTYDFFMPADILLHSAPVHVSHLAAFRIIEVQTGRTLRSNSIVVPNSHGFVGKAILPLEPSLHRKNRGHRSTVLHQACHLVKLDKPLLKGNKDLK